MFFLLCIELYGQRQGLVDLYLGSKADFILLLIFAIDDIAIANMFLISIVDRQSLVSPTPSY